jgi:hypothetical protein
MAEYIPLFDDGDEITRTASAAITGGQALVVSGDDTVAPSSAASAAFLGIAAFDAASGADVTVHIGKVHLLTSTGAINAGDPVTCAAAGAIAAFSGTTYSTIIGKALKAAAANQVVVRLF